MKKSSQPRVDLKNPANWGKAKRKKVVLAGTVVLGGLAGNILLPGIGGAIFGGGFAWLIGSEDEEKNKMSKIPVFYSFHFKNDVMRVQQIRNIGTIEGNTPTTPNLWESLKLKGDTAVQGWIDKNLKYKRCVVVLIGSETASRPWIRYEITKAWNDGKALIGVHIHNIKCPRNGTSRKGRNPFDDLQFKNGRKLSSVIPCYDPDPANTYRDIAENISGWITHAIDNKQN